MFGPVKEQPNLTFILNFCQYSKLSFSDNLSINIKYLVFFLYFYLKYADKTSFFLNLAKIMPRIRLNQLEYLSELLLAFIYKALILPPPDRGSLLHFRF